MRKHNLNLSTYHRGPAIVGFLPPFSAAKSLSLESTIHNGSTSWDPTLVGKPSVPQDGSQGRARYTGGLGESAENLSDHERLHAAYGVGGKNRV
jgi:hypothetical protein